MFHLMCRDPYLLWLAATLGVEAVAVLAAVGCRLIASGVGAPWMLAAVVSMNLLTHPLAAMASAVGDWSWLPIEMAVVAAEAMAFRVLARVAWPAAWGLSAAANCLTAAIGWTWAVC